MPFGFFEGKKKAKKDATNTTEPTPPIVDPKSVKDKKKIKKPTNYTVEELSPIVEPFNGSDISFFGGDEYILTPNGIVIGQGNEEAWKKFATPKTIPTQYSSHIHLTHSFDNHCIVNSLGNINEVDFVYQDRDTIVTVRTQESWYSAQFSPVAPILAVGGKRKLLIYENYAFETPSHIVPVAHNENISSLDFTLDGQTLASVSWDKQLTLWNTTDWSTKASVAANENHLKFVKFSNDNERMATGGNNSRLKLWDAATLQNIATLSKSGTMVNCCWSPCDRYLATIHQHAVSIWDICSNLEIATLNTAPQQLGKLCVAHPQNGNFYVPGIADKDKGHVIWTFQFPTDHAVKSARM